MSKDKYLASLFDDWCAEHYNPSEMSYVDAVNDFVSDLLMGESFTGEALIDALTDNYELIELVQDHREALGQLIIRTSKTNINLHPDKDVIQFLRACRKSLANRLLAHEARMAL